MKTVATLFLMAGLAAPIAAQQHAHGTPSESASGAGMACPMMGMSGMMDGMNMMDGMEMDSMMGPGGMAMMTGHGVMMDAMRLMPNRVLGLADSLGLTNDQVRRIREIQERHAERQDRRETMQHRFDALREAFDAESPDPMAVQLAADAALTMHAQSQARHLASGAAVRAVLTGDQRDRLTALVGCPMSMGMMQTGGMHGPQKQQ